MDLVYNWKTPGGIIKQLTIKSDTMTESEAREIAYNHGWRPHLHTDERPTETAMHPKHLVPAEPEDFRSRAWMFFTVASACLVISALIKGGWGDAFFVAGSLTAFAAGWTIVEWQSR